MVTTESKAVMAVYFFRFLSAKFVNKIVDVFDFNRHKSF